MKSLTFNSSINTTWWPTLILLAGVILPCVDGHAVIQTNIRSVFTQSSKHPNPKSCKALLSLPNYEVQQVKMNPLDNGPGEARAEVLTVNERSEITIQWVDEVLREWEKSGHYTPEQIKFLRNREMNLAPERTAYLSFEYRGRLTGLRIFDGSTFPVLESLEWSHIYAKDFRTPIEKQYSIRLPERKKDRAYIWELGLLSAPKFFHEGVHVNLVQLARTLDSNYNRNQMGAFGSTDFIGSLGFTIYGVAREKLVPHYEKLGFQRVRRKSSGENVVFEDGMVLIRMSGKTLLEKFFWERSIPETDDYSYTLPSSGFGNRYERAMTNYSQLMQRSLIQLSPAEAVAQLKSIYGRLSELDRIHEKERQELADFQEAEMRAGRPAKYIFIGQEKQTDQILFDLYVVWHSLPPHMVSPAQWQYMVGQINFFLSIFSAEGAVKLAKDELERSGLIDR